MISLIDACKAAKEYFTANLGKDCIAKVSMNEQAWFFISGEPARVSIGNIVISVDKQNGSIALIDLLSDEGYAQIIATTPIDLP